MCFHVVLIKVGTHACFLNSDVPILQQVANDDGTNPSKKYVEMLQDLGAK